MAVAAFFDFDDTLFRGNSGIRHISNYFFSLRMNPLYGFAIVSSAIVNYVIRNDPDRFFGRVYMFMKGKRIDEEAVFCRQNYDKMSHRVYAEAVRLVRWHKRKGHIVAVVTNSVDFMVDQVLGQLGIEHLIATRLQAKRGILTGKTKAINFGRHKAAAIRAFARKHKISLKKSYAYSDNNSDIHMLSQVGNPVAVNPKRKMRQHAKRHSWKIMTLR